MDIYHPLIEPNKDEWLESSEYDRIDAVRKYHENSDEDEFEEGNALSIHSMLHVIVENQLAMGIELNPETIEKLTQQGLDRHEAIYAIGAIISDDIFYIVRGDKTEFSPTEYQKKLEKNYS